MPGWRISRGDVRSTTVPRLVMRRIVSKRGIFLVHVAERPSIERGGDRESGGRSCDHSDGVSIRCESKQVYPECDADEQCIQSAQYGYEEGGMRSLKRSIAPYTVKVYATDNRPWAEHCQKERKPYTGGCYNEGEAYIGQDKDGEDSVQGFEDRVRVECAERLDGLPRHGV